MQLYNAGGTELSWPPVSTMSGPGPSCSACERERGGRGGEGRGAERIQGAGLGEMTGNDKGHRTINGATLLPARQRWLEGQNSRRWHRLVKRKKKKLHVIHDHKINHVNIPNCANV